METLQSHTEWLNTSQRIDREAGVIVGYNVAQEGAFQTPGRGEFDVKALMAIVGLMKANVKGTKSRLGHPNGISDAIGTFLGRAKNPRLDMMRRDNGKLVSVVRADLHFDRTAFKTPSGDLAGYILDLAESDPAAFATSLVLTANLEYRLSKGGTLVKDANGNPLPPLWRPTGVMASDVVDSGEIVDSFLSPSHLTEQDRLLRDENSRRLDAMLKNRCLMQQDAMLRQRLSRFIGDPSKRLATIAGRIPFGSLSVRRNDEKFGLCREVIEPGALLLSSTDDVVATLEHNYSKSLARCSTSTLALSQDERGLIVTCTLSDTPAGREALAGVRDGTLRGMSFTPDYRTQRYQRGAGVVPVVAFSRLGVSEVCFCRNASFDGSSVWLVG